MPQRGGEGSKGTRDRPIRRFIVRCPETSAGSGGAVVLGFALLYGLALLLARLL